MKYIELKNTLKDFTLFSLNDIRKIEFNFFRSRLNEWQGKGFIKKIINGYYLFSDLNVNDHALFEIANRIYSPSYISFEMALSYYNLIPESVYKITSASTRKTSKFTTPLAQFHYRTIAPKFYFGYEIIEYNSKHFKIASMEKALLDFFYINNYLNNKADFESLRINKDVINTRINRKQLREFLGRFNKKSLTRRINSFMEFVKHV